MAKSVPMSLHGSPQAANDRIHGSTALLVCLVAARFLLHAVYLPAYEGPDEPFHLARIAAMADGPWQAAISGETVPAEIVASVRDHPCGPDLSRAFACPPFPGAPGGGAAFNAVVPGHPPEGSLPGATYPNYEAHQPPIFYGVAAVVPFALGLETPESRLIAARLLSALLALAGVAAAFRFLAPGPPRWVFLGFLLLPGAAESLVRCANDGAVFLWTAVALALVTRPRPRTWTPAWLAVGPLVKLTVLPGLAFAVALLWVRGRRRGAVISAAGAALAVPLQMLRGFAWGGTVELNVSPAGPGAFEEPLGQVLLGLAHSVYTSVKTFVWLGGWSTFRPPQWILLGGLVLALGAALLLRPSGPLRRIWAGNSPGLPHLLALMVALGGYLTFAVGQRQLFGIWGGVGGWYLWGWLPWLALLARDGLRWRGSPPAGKVLAWAAAAWLVCVNAAWWVAAHQLYGSAL